MARARLLSALELSLHGHTTRSPPDGLPNAVDKADHGGRPSSIDRTPVPSPSGRGDRVRQGRSKALEIRKNEVGRISQALEFPPPSGEGNLDPLSHWERARVRV